MIARLAFRNALRDRQRSALTAAAVACSVGLLLVALCWAEGLMGALMTSFLEEYGDARVVAPAYVRRERTLSLRSSLPGAEALAARVRALPGVRSCAERIKFAAVLEKADVLQEGVTAVALDPDAEAGLPSLGSDLVAGRAPRAGQREAAVGKLTAERLGAGLGDEVTLVTSDFNGCLQGARLRISGIFHRGAAQLDRRILVPLDVARAVLDMEDRATELVVGATDPGEVTLVPRLRAALAADGVAVQDWQEASGMARILSIGFQINAVLALIFCCAAALGVLNTMLMNVMERTPEIGLLGALGMAPRTILALFLAEALALGVAGATVGCAGGSLVAWRLAATGIRIDSRGLENLPLPAPDVVRGLFTWDTAARAWALGVTTAVLAALWPAWLASRLEPVRALRRN